MSAKLHINLRQGVIEADGEPDFVEKVYKDFKAEVLKRLAALETDGEEGEPEIVNRDAQGNGARRLKRAAKRAGDGKKGGKRRPSCATRILDLKEKKVFAKGLFARDVKAKLLDSGHAYAANLVGASLAQLHSQGKLRRMRKDGKWLYLNP